MARIMGLSKLGVKLFLVFVSLLATAVNGQHRDAPTVWNSSLTSTEPVEMSLFGRQTLPAGTCSETIPCADGSCCSGISYFCGRDPQYCQASVCISNCEAKADCGIGALVPGTKCPLNVCCGPWGYCGTTPDFCAPPAGVGEGCQSNCVQPAATGLSDGNVTNLVIGYFEAWAPTESGCAQRDVSFIRTDSITHLYVAFGYIQPGTYEIIPMPTVDLGTITQIMNLKQSAPGLRIYISLGGWDYTNNDTATQPVWGDLSSSTIKRTTFVNNLAKFMRYWGFDGVDLDWEYPGAGDRGGNPVDTENYVNLVHDIRAYWDAQSPGWGLSFTAPTSYWYMRWFDIGNMTQYVDWVNLMTYDLHGSWDSPEDDIGSFVYAHTNLTEITAALDLLWRNDVPASKVNLGLGFYGRSYTLSDPSCSLPGCPFSAPGTAGACTQNNGTLSYAEITAIQETYQVNTVYDPVAGVNYISWSQNQWVSFDDVRTLKQKVDYANQNGLLGVFIWALDLDATNWTALNAVLDPVGGLGAFKEQNGVGISNFTDWVPGEGICVMGGCSPTPGCPGGYQIVGPSVRCDSTQERRYVCCPPSFEPSASECTWRGSDGTLLGLGQCTQSCQTGEINVAENDWYYVENPGGGSPDANCKLGTEASYCCKTQDETTSQLCTANEGTCIGIKNGQPDGTVAANLACPEGSTFVSYSQGDCQDGLWLPWCCQNDYTEGSQCYWGVPLQDLSLTGQCSAAQGCKNGFVNLGYSEKGEGQDCQWWAPNFSNSPIIPQSYKRVFCCPAASLSIFSQQDPVPLDWLFPNATDSADQEKWDMDIDTTDEGGDGASEDPETNGFGWMIMAGPSDELTSMDKRDGSHWELFDCPKEKHEGRQVVRAVCTDESADSNCGVIFTGAGVAETVVELPHECGAGRHAVAVSMVPAEPDSYMLPNKTRHRLYKRGIVAPRVYHFTYDFDFSPLQKRDSPSNVMVRIDFSSDPGYWLRIVDSPAKVRRELEMEVDQHFDGDWKTYLEHSFRKEKRETPDHELHNLQKKWFSADLADWMSGQVEVQTQWNLIRHSINEVSTWYLFNERLSCNIAGIPTQAYFAVWAELNVNIQTSVELTLIGNLGDLSSFQESHLLFRNKGSITSTLNMEALAQLSFSTGDTELFGLKTFGGSLYIPGLVTIGPTFKVLAQLTGQMSIHTSAQLTIDIADWDYTQQYPNPNSDVASGLSETLDQPGDSSTGVGTSDFHADVTASGDITAWIKPVLQVGVEWASNLNVPDATVGLQLDTYVTLYGSGTVSTSNAPQICYGANIGMEMFAQINAPSLFNINFNQRYTIPGLKFDTALIEQKCYDPIPFDNTQCEYCDDGPTSGGD